MKAALIAVAKVALISGVLALIKVGADALYKEAKREGLTVDF